MANATCQAREPAEVILSESSRAGFSAYSRRKRPTGELTGGCHWGMGIDCYSPGY